MTIAGLEPEPVGDSGNGHASGVLAAHRARSASRCMRRGGLVLREDRPWIECIVVPNVPSVAGRPCLRHERLALARRPRSPMIVRDPVLRTIIGDHLEVVRVHARLR